MDDTNRQVQILPPHPMIGTDKENEMGEIADAITDSLMEREFDFDEDVCYWLTQTDDELKKQSAASRLPIILSIRKFAKLSPKQRNVLATWIANRDEP